MDAPCRQSIKKETWNIFLKNKEKRGTMYENNSNH